MLKTSKKFLNNLIKNLIKVLIILFAYHSCYVISLCPQIICNPSAKYRTIDGTCNNLENPSLGTANSPYVRLAPIRYVDGIKTPVGDELPNARLVTAKVFREKSVSDRKYTLLTMQWGQFIAHDLVLTRQTPGAACCTPDGKYTSIFSNECMDISIPPNDQVFENKMCMAFSRSAPFQDPCFLNNEVRDQGNSETHFLDLSQLYGSSLDVNFSIREFFGGRLATSTIRNYDMLPLATHNCVLDDTNSFCFRAADPRSNQTPGLVTLQTILLRNHNRLANQLSDLHPEWNDEQRFQEARRINIAQYQYITYHEYLPTILGNMAVSDILSNKYDKTADPSIINEFTAAAFRYLHIQISGKLGLYRGNRKFEGHINLSDVLFKPAFLTVNMNMDKVLRGMTIESLNAADNFYDPEITRFLFKFNKTLGIDLRAVDIQRGRDHGIASYNDIREYCGLKRATTFEDFQEMSDASTKLLKSVYNHPDDVDLMTGGSLEYKIEDTPFGPTFHCIVMEQFNNTLTGDRFFYNSDDHNAGFTPEQLNEITNKTSLAALICQNSNIGRIQRFPFLQNIDSVENPLMSCSLLPSLNFKYWK